MRNLVLILILGSVVLSCAARVPSGSTTDGDDFDLAGYHRERLKEFEQAKAVFSSADGISRTEARLLAQEYFALWISGCGYPEEPEDAGEYWISLPRIGYAGEAGEHLIRIEKSSGDVLYAPVGRTPAYLVLERAERRLQENVERFARYGGTQK